MKEESLRSVLRAYSNGGMTEDETVQVIKDLFDTTVINNYPYSPPLITYPWTYDYEGVKKFEVTCKP